MDINKQDELGKTPLIHASCYNNIRLVKELCDRGADVDVQDHNGVNALMVADDIRIVKELCDRGANLNAQDRNGYTALSWAAYYRDGTQITTELCTRGAKVYCASTNKVLIKQQFRRNVLVLVGFLQIDLLRCVHSWI